MLASASSSPAPKALSFKMHVSGRDVAVANGLKPKLDLPRSSTARNAEARAPVTSRSAIQSSFSRFSAESIFSRRPSIQSQTAAPSGNAHITTPTLVKTPWEQERLRRGSTWKRPKMPLPAHIFEAMPQEVYECILRQLDLSYFAKPASTCAMCFLGDLCNLAKMSKMWNKVVRAHMYRIVRIPATASNPSSTGKSKTEVTDRLKLLLRTLRGHPQLSRGVRELHVPDWLRVYEFANQEERNDIVEHLSAIVMSCVNLERLIGFYTVYNHELDSLTQALSTRTRLKERLWIIRDDRTLIKWQQIGEDGDKDAYSRPDYANGFLQRHVHWASLETLVLFGHDGSTGMDYRAFVGTFRKLQCLKRLSIATFPAQDFNDRTLQAVPAVHSLRLQNLPGVTDRGLSKFLDTEAASILRTMTMIDLEITSLAVVTKVLNRCEQLRKFTFAQDATPAMPPDETTRQQSLSSASLEYLHWDTLVPGSASDVLASCIAGGAFPSLTKIRAPTDYSGQLQRLCRPLAQIAYESDGHLLRHMNDSPVDETHYTRNLTYARHAAQARIEAARGEPSMKIVVEEEGMVHHVYTMRGYIGRVDSKIKYCLEPDVQGSNDALLGLADLISSKGQDGMEYLCRGPIAASQNGSQENWQHRPRKFSRLLEMKSLF